jgi:hypothetical protein
MRVINSASARAPRTLWERACPRRGRARPQQIQRLAPLLVPQRHQQLTQAVMIDLMHQRQ